MFLSEIFNIITKESVIQIKIVLKIHIGYGKQMTKTLISFYTLIKSAL